MCALHLYTGRLKITTFTMLSLLFFSVLQLVLLAAWVSGYLDPYQKKLQEIILDTMGETTVSYGLKSRSYH